ISYGLIQIDAGGKFASPPDDVYSALHGGIARPSRGALPTHSQQKLAAPVSVNVSRARDLGTLCKRDVLERAKKCCDQGEFATAVKHVQVGNGRIRSSAAN